MWRILSLIICLLVPYSLLFADASISNCSVDANRDGASFLKNCGSNTLGIKPDGPQGIDGMKARIVNIAKKTIQFGALLAVGALVFAGIQYTTSYGDDEKLKHAKTTGIFAVVWLLLLMASFGLVDIIVRFIYEIVGNT